MSRAEDANPIYREVFHPSQLENPNPRGAASFLLPSHSGKQKCHLGRNPASFVWVEGWPVSYVTSFSSRVGYLGRNMFINMVLLLMIMHLAWKVVGENWG